MGAGCCGEYSGTGYTAVAATRKEYGTLQSYGQHTPGLRLDPLHSMKDPPAHMNGLYKPKPHMPYTRAEDGHAAALLEERAAARLTSPASKYGSRMAQILYSNVSGV